MSRILNSSVHPAHFYVVKMCEQAGKLAKIFDASMLAYLKTAEYFTWTNQICSTSSKPNKISIDFELITKIEYFQKHMHTLLIFLQARLLVLWSRRPQRPLRQWPRLRQRPQSLLDRNGYTVSIVSRLSATLGIWWFTCKRHTCWTFTNWPTLQSCKMWV